MAVSKEKDLKGQDMGSSLSLSSRFRAPFFKKRVPFFFGGFHKGAIRVTIGVVL